MASSDDVIALVHDHSTAGLAVTLIGTIDKNSEDAKPSEPKSDKPTKEESTERSQTYSRMSEEVCPIRDVTFHKKSAKKVDVRYMNEIKSLKEKIKSSLLTCNQQQCPTMRERLARHQIQYHQGPKIEDVCSTKVTTSLRDQCVNVSPTLSRMRLPKFNIPMNDEGRAVQTDITMRDFSPNRNFVAKQLTKITSENLSRDSIPLRRTETREVLPSRNFYKEHLQNEILNWLQNVPMFYTLNFTTKDIKENIVSNLAENINTLAVEVNDSNYEIKAKIEIENCLSRLPMWLPGSKREQTVFKDGLREKLWKKLQELNENFLGVKYEKASGCDSEDDKLKSCESYEREVVNWSLKLQLNDQKCVSRRQIVDLVMKRLSPLLKIPLHTTSYKLILKGEIIDILDDLPLALSSPKYRTVHLNRFAEELANRLLSVQLKNEPSNSIHAGRESTVYHQFVDQILGIPQPKYRQNLRNIIQDKVKESLNKVHVCHRNDLKTEICSTFIDSQENLRTGDDASIQSEISQFLRDTGKLSEDRTNGVAKMIMRNIKDSIKEIKNTATTSFDSVMPELSGAVSVYMWGENKPPITSTPKKPSKKEIPKLNKEEMSYVNRVAALVSAWMDTLPKQFNEDKNFKQTIINDLAGDIMDELKVEQLAPETTSDKEKFLKYLMYRWFYRYEFFDDATIRNDAKPFIQDFLVRLKEVEVPKLTAPQYGNRQAMENIKHMEGEYGWQEDYVPKGIDVLEDQISVWLNDQPSEIYANKDKGKRDKMIHDLALTLQDRLRNKSPEDDIEKDINQWLKKMVKPKEKEHIGLLTHDLKEKVKNLPQDQTLEAKYEDKKRQIADRIATKKQLAAQPTSGVSKLTNLGNIEGDPDEPLRNFIDKFIDRNYNINNEMTKDAFSQLLKTELRKLSPPVRNEIYEYFDRSIPHAQFLPENYKRELEYLKTISDWLNDIKVEPVYNLPGNRDRIDFVNDLARNILEIEDQRIQSPDEIDYNYLIASVIMQSIHSYGLPIVPEHKDNTPIMVDQLLKKIIALRGETDETQSSIVASTFSSPGGTQSLTMSDIQEQNLSDFIADYIRVNGRDIAHDKEKLDAWTKNLHDELNKMIQEGADPLTLGKAEVYNRFSEVPFPDDTSANVNSTPSKKSPKDAGLKETRSPTPTDKSNKLSSLEQDYNKEISEWLKNLPLLPQDQPKAREEIKKMNSELAAKMAEIQPKRNADPNDNAAEKELENYVATWISRLPLDPGKEVVVPIVTAQLMNRMEKVNKDHKINNAQPSNARPISGKPTDSRPRAKSPASSSERDARPSAANATDAELQDVPNLKEARPSVGWSMDASPTSTNAAVKDVGDKSPVTARPSNALSSGISPTGLPLDSSASESQPTAEIPVFQGAMPTATETGPMNVQLSQAGPATGRPSDAIPMTARLSQPGPTTGGPMAARPSQADPMTTRPSEAIPMTGRFSQPGPTGGGPGTARLSQAFPKTARPSDASPKTARFSQADPTSPVTANPLGASPGTFDPTIELPSKTSPSPSETNPADAGHKETSPSTAFPTDTNLTDTHPSDTRSKTGRLKNAFSLKPRQADASPTRDTGRPEADSTETHPAEANSDDTQPKDARSKAGRFKDPFSKIRPSGARNMDTSDQSDSQTSAEVSESDSKDFQENKEKGKSDEKGSKDKSNKSVLGHIKGIKESVSKTCPVCPASPKASKSDKCKKNPAEIIVEAIENWSHKLPIKGKDKDAIKTMKEDVARRLYQKIGELNVDPRIFNDDVLYKEMLGDEIDTQLENIPQNSELQKKREKLKDGLLNTILDTNKLIKERSAGDNYKHKLESSIDSAIPYPVQITQTFDPGFEMYKSRLADMFILENFDHSNDDVKIKYEQRIRQEVDKYFETAQNKNALPLTKDQMYNELYSALFKVPMPNESSVIDEVEQVKTRCEVDAWFEGLPLKEADGLGELLEWDKILSTLTKRIHEIEKHEPKPNKKIFKEIVKWLEKLPLQPGNHDLHHYAYKLQSELIATYDDRRYIGPDCVAPCSKKELESKCKRTANTSQRAGPSNADENKFYPRQGPQSKSTTAKPCCLVTPMAKKKPGDIIVEVVEEWCNQLPLKSKEDNNKIIRDNISTRIIIQVSELNMDPEIFNDDVLYDELLDEELENVLSNLPVDADFQKSKAARKYQLKEIIKSIKPLVKEEKARHEYKEELNSTIASILKEPQENNAENKKLLFSKIKDDIIESFVEYNYYQNDEDAKQMQKRNMLESVEKYFEEVKDKGYDDQVEPLVRRNQILCELTKIPVPNDALKEEMEEIKMKKEVEQLFRELSVPESEEQNKMLKNLSKRLCDIEKSGHNCATDKKMKTDIARCLKKLKKDVSPKIIDDFVLKLRDNEAARKAPPRTSSQTGRRTGVPGSSEYGPRRKADQTYSESSNQTPPRTQDSCCQKPYNKPVGPVIEVWNPNESFFSNQIMGQHTIGYDDFEGGDLLSSTVAPPGYAQPQNHNLSCVNYEDFEAGPLLSSSVSPCQGAPGRPNQYMCSRSLSKNQPRSSYRGMREAPSAPVQRRRSYGQFVTPRHVAQSPRQTTQSPFKLPQSSSHNATPGNVTPDSLFNTHYRQGLHRPLPVPIIQPSRIPSSVGSNHSARKMLQSPENALVPSPHNFQLSPQLLHEDKRLMSLGSSEEEICTCERCMKTRNRRRLPLYMVSMDDFFDDYFSFNSVWCGMQFPECFYY